MTRKIVLITMTSGHRFTDVNWRTPRRKNTRSLSPSEFLPFAMELVPAAAEFEAKQTFLAHLGDAVFRHLQGRYHCIAQPELDLLEEANRFVACHINREGRKVPGVFRPG